MANRREELLARLKNNIAFASKAVGLLPSQPAVIKYDNAASTVQDSGSGSYAKMQHSDRPREYTLDNKPIGAGVTRDSDFRMSEKSIVDDVSHGFDDVLGRSLPVQRSVAHEPMSNSFMQSVMSFLSPQYQPVEAREHCRNASFEDNSRMQRFSPGSSGMQESQASYSDVQHDEGSYRNDNSRLDTSSGNSRNDEGGRQASSRINYTRQQANVPDRYIADPTNRSLVGVDQSRSSYEMRNSMSSGRMEPYDNETIHRPSPPLQDASAVGKSPLTNDEREQMVNAMEEMHSNVTMLEEALSNLVQMKERMLDRPPDQQRDTLLKENARMQQDITTQLSALRQAAKEIADELLADVARLVTIQQSSIGESYTEPTSARKFYTDSVQPRQSYTDTVSTRQPFRDPEKIQLTYIDNGGTQKPFTNNVSPRRSYGDDIPTQQLRTDSTNFAMSTQDSDLDDFAIDAAMQQSHLIFAAMNQQKIQQGSAVDNRSVGQMGSEPTRKSSSLNNGRNSQSPSGKHAQPKRKASRELSREKSKPVGSGRPRSASNDRTKSRRRDRSRSDSSSSSGSNNKSSNRRRSRRSNNRHSSDSREAVKIPFRHRGRKRSTSRIRSRSRSKGRRNRSRSRGERNRARLRARNGRSRSSSSRNRSRDKNRARSGLRENKKETTQKKNVERSKSQQRANKEKADLEAKAAAERAAVKQKEDAERAAMEMTIALYMNAESYYDAGGAWCRKCSCMLVDLPDLCKHLHTEEHLRKIDENFDVKRPAVVEPISGATAPARGEEFLLPMVSYFCSLCCEFSKDRIHAEAHIKSAEHNNKFKEFLKDNTSYEIQYLKEKKLAALAKQEELTRVPGGSVVDPIVVEQSSTDVSKPADNKFQIKFTGSLKQAPRKLVVKKSLDLSDNDSDIQSDEKQTNAVSNAPIQNKFTNANLNADDLQVKVNPLPTTLCNSTVTTTGYHRTSSTSKFPLSITNSTTGAKSFIAPKPKVHTALYRPSPSKDIISATKSLSSKTDEEKNAATQKSGLLSSLVLFHVPKDEELHTPMMLANSDTGWQLSALRSAPVVVLPPGSAKVENKQPAWTLLPPTSSLKASRAPAVRISAVSASTNAQQNFMRPSKIP